jgi:hypothetical protein
MVMITAFSGMGSACAIKLGPHSALVGRANLPLQADNFRVTFWFDNGVHGSRSVEGFKTLAEAKRFAQSVLPDGFLSAAREVA